jgi:hypothetical protein
MAGDEAMEQVLAYAGITHPMEELSDSMSDPFNFSGRLQEDLKEALKFKEASGDPTMSMHRALKEVVSRRGDSENRLYVGLVVVEKSPCGNCKNPQTLDITNP